MAFVAWCQGIGIDTKERGMLQYQSHVKKCVGRAIDGCLGQIAHCCSVGRLVGHRRDMYRALAVGLGHGTTIR